MTVQIGTTELSREIFPIPRGEYKSPYVDWDMAGDEHELIIYTPASNTDDSTTLRYTKRSPAGTVLESGSLRPAPDGQGKPMKFVDTGTVLVVVPPGGGMGTIVLPFAIHGTGPTVGGRVMAWGYHTIPGVYAPHPPGTRANERFDVTLPEEGGTVGLTQDDRTWIESRMNAAATAAVDAFDQRLGGQAPRDDLKGLISGQLAASGVLRVGSTADEKYAMLRHDTKDGAFEALLSLLGIQYGTPEYRAFQRAVLAFINPYWTPAG